MNKVFPIPAVVGWILAWITEDNKYYCFEFFQEKDADGKYIEYSYKDKILRAMPRVSSELELLLSGKELKYGMKVIHGYIHPITLHQNCNFEDY